MRQIVFCFWIEGNMRYFWCLASFHSAKLCHVHFHVSTRLCYVGHCKKLAPAWRELANTYEGIDEVNVAHVDCTVDKEVCSKYEVSPWVSRLVILECCTWIALFPNGQHHPKWEYCLVAAGERLPHPKNVLCRGWICQLQRWAAKVELFDLLLLACCWLIALHTCN